ncbi:MAG: undecaprenyl-phosphate glucose phosphotransferase [Oleibacter sp.]|nr:undecaprenyl-phosphate glucose phosphotransferase [Thalassolituus sp.]
MTNQGMIRSNQGSFSFGYRLIDIAVIMLTLFISVSAFDMDQSIYFLSAGLISVILFMLVAESLQLYRSWRGSPAIRMLTHTSIAWILVCVGLFTIGFFAKVSESYSRLVIGTWMLGTWCSLLIWRGFFRQLLREARIRGYNSRTVAIVGINDSAIRMRQEMEESPELGLRFSGFYDDRCHERLLSEFPDEHLNGTIDQLIEMTRSGKFQVIFVALPLKAQKRIGDILKKCGDTTASVHLIPDFFTYNLLNARLCEVGNMQTLSVYDSPIFGINDVLKRLFDIVFSLSVLSVILIPMAIIAAAIKVTSPGPVIFKQIRYGLDSRRIEVWKFRSMTAMDNGNKVVQAKKGDARITKVGAFIRRTSLDELPQFINVLQGSMSVVGPRPHAVAHNEEYRKLIPFYMLRHKVKPGITGWAQINGYRGETDTLDKMEGRVEYDLDYIRNWSLWMDVKIVFLTFFKGFVGSNVH